MGDRSPLPRLALVAAMLLLHFAASSASAQVVSGTLVDSDGQALEGAMVSLLDTDGVEVANVLSGPAGTFELTGPAGEYRVRADRIGHASTFAGPFSVEVGQTHEIHLVATVEAIRLDGLDIEGDRRCRVRPEEGLAVAQAWEEARKALAAAAWTQDRGVYRFEMTRFQRSLDVDARRVLDESRTVSGGYVRSPYEARPAEQLRREGYAAYVDGGMSYYAPDASVLLSDDFLDTHCFRLEEGENETRGLIGLAFEPTPGRDVADIEGTLWIDPETTMLRWLEYGYRNLPLPPEVVTGFVGGRVDFSALPNGTWIVSSWEIRMPRPGMRVDPMSGRREPYLLGFSVAGGEVLRAYGRAGPIFAAEEDGSRIVGAVFDSLRVGGLEGAEVYAVGTQARAVTGFDGRFVMGGLEPGVYEVTFRHAYLDALSWTPEPFLVDVPADTTVQINFLAPPARRVMSDLCGQTEQSRRSAVRPGESVHPPEAIVTGTVRDTGGSPVAGATVRALWREWELTEPSGNDRSRVDEGRLGVTATSDAAGRYRICWVPADVPLEVDVLERIGDLDPGKLPTADTPSLTRDEGGDRFVVDGGVMHGTRDLVLDRGRTGSITGTVTDGVGGAALPGVTVTLVELARTITTDASGAFEFDVVPTGELSVRAALEDLTATSPPLVVRAGGVTRTTVVLPSPGTGR